MVERRTHEAELEKQREKQRLEAEVAGLGAEAVGFVAEVQKFWPGAELVAVRKTNSVDIGAVVDERDDHDVTS